MSGLNGLRLAVPRGALMGETLDLLDALGTDTAEVRSNDRKLLFEDAGIVTMRPSDVPTYVEAGAAEIGIVGKDVLAEQAERGVYELLDLRFGPCVMVVASTAGEDRLAEALRRLGVMRVATKYPQDGRAPLRPHRPPGRDRRGQGLGRARAADRAGGGDRRPHRHRQHAARERPRRARGDPRVDRAADRQPRRPQAARRRARRCRGAHAGGAGAMVERLAVAVEDAAADRPSRARATCRRRRRSTRWWPGSSRRSRRAATTPC